MSRKCDSNKVHPGGSEDLRIVNMITVLAQI